MSLRLASLLVTAAAGIALVVVSAVVGAAPANEAKPSTPGARNRRPAAPREEAADVRGLAAVEGSGVKVGYLIGPAQGWYRSDGGRLHWRDPAPAETHYFGVVVEEAEGGRPVPGCRAIVSLKASDGRDVATSVPLAYLWHPRLPRYGANVSIKETTGPLTATVVVESPAFGRHDRERGTFFARPLVRSWSGVEAGPPVAARSSRGTSDTEHGDFGEGRYKPVEPTPYPGALTVKK